jgi:hypothetical protein
MDIIFVLLFLGLFVWIGWNLVKKPDQNGDGKVDVKDALVVAKETVAEVKAAADVNKDGEVGVADVKAAVAKVKKGRKKKVAE